MSNIWLSKNLSYLLRHHPEDADLILDIDGYTTISIGELANRLSTTEDLIRTVVEEDAKKRFTIKNDRIRANYGHSITIGKKMFERSEEIPVEELPDYLFHGTKQNVLKNILKEGLTSQNRQMVHLSITQEWAQKIGQRRKGKTVILRIDTQKAKQFGLVFYKAGPTTILTDKVPSELLEVVPN